MRDERTKDERVAAVAAKQDSLITIDDAYRLGMTTADLRYRCHIGRLVQVRRGVFRLAGAPQSWEQQVRAVCLAAGCPVVASHRTAQLLHAFLHAEQPPEIEITEPWPLRTRLAGVRAHRVNLLDRADVTRVRGIPVTTVARTVIDIASYVSERHLDTIVNDLLRRRLLTIPKLEAAAGRVDDSRLRRRMAPIRVMVANKRNGFHPGDSDPEIEMVNMLVRAGLPRPVQQFRPHIPGRNFRLDAAYPEYRVGLEYEGEDGHGLPGDRGRDRRRWNAITAAGWDIRFLVKEMSEREWVADVRAALGRAGAAIGA